MKRKETIEARQTPGPLKKEEMDEMLDLFHGLRATQRRFLISFCKWGTVARACEDAQCCERAHQNWMREEGYPDIFLMCKRRFQDRLEAEAVRRAVDGWDEVSGYTKEGRPIIKRRYSDRLLELLLRAHMPEKYSVAAQQMHKTEVELINKIIIQSDRGDRADPKRILNHAERTSGNGKQLAAHD